MKKLIFLMMVVGIASAANARMVLEFQHGDADTVDLVAIVGFTPGDDIYFAIVGDASEVTVSGGTVGVLAPDGPVPHWTAIYGYDAQANGMCSAPLDGMWGFIGKGTDPLPPGLYIDEIQWTLVGGATEAEIQLIGTPDFIVFTTLDTITVPEPMTVALLGLGGMLLLRRRR